MPAAWMISSNAIQETITYFLRTIATHNPTVMPAIVMSDKDQAQMNAVRDVFPKSRLYLCWWHVLHAWQQHFNICAYPVLWEKLKLFIRITDEQQFWREWEAIQACAPPSVTKYLTDHWLKDRSIVMLWSAVYRTDRSIFADCDTNMLVEAYVLEFSANG